MHLAADRAHVDMVRLLGSKGASLPSMDAKGRTPMYAPPKEELRAVLQRLRSIQASGDSADLAALTAELEDAMDADAEAQETRPNMELVREAAASRTMGVFLTRLLSCFCRASAAWPCSAPCCA